jgi:hypothetical protein
MSRLASAAPPSDLACQYITAPMDGFDGVPIRAQNLSKCRLLQCAPPISVSLRVRLLLGLLSRQVRAINLGLAAGAETVPTSARFGVEASTLMRLDERHSRTVDGIENSGLPRPMR